MYAPVCVSMSALVAVSMDTIELLLGVGTLFFGWP